MALAFIVRSHGHSANALTPCCPADSCLYLNLTYRHLFEALTGIVGLDFVSPNNTCFGFNNSSCWARGNHQLLFNVKTITLSADVRVQVDHTTGPKKSDVKISDIIDLIYIEQPDPV